ncbi:MAG: hypothetical protein AAF614_12880 [Chloroflexota bacterium]
MSAILTPERLPILLMFISFAIFSTTRRNRGNFHMGWGMAAFYATLEILAQGALFGFVFYAFVLLALSFFPSRWGLFLSLVLTVILIVRPARRVTTNIEAFLAASFGQKEKEDPFKQNGG